MKMLKFGAVAGLAVAGAWLLAQQLTDKQPLPQLATTRVVTPIAADRRTVASALDRLPIQFEVNEGQFDPKVLYSARGPGYTLFMTPDETVLSLRASAAVAETDVDRSEPGGRAVGARRTSARARHGALAADRQPTSGQLPVQKPGAVLRTRLVGANPSPAVAATDRLAGVSNYFLGKDPAKHHTNVAQYARLRYSEVYPGVDLVYYGSQQQLEYDFVVAPGADPDQIRFAYTGADQVSINTAGDLVIGTASGEVVQHKPLIYQERDGKRTEVRGGYRFADPSKAVGKDGNTVVAFSLGQYDTRLPLVIDPVLVYSTYLGGTLFDGVTGIAVDNQSNIYVVGETYSSDFPTLNPIQAHTAPIGPQGDIFIAKLNPSGSALMYSTYVGGSGNEAVALNLAVDASGAAYVAGNTASTDFPTVNPIQATNLGGGDPGEGGGDAYAFKLNPAGNALIYSTYLGGTDAETTENISIDSAGDAYLSGFTTSTDFPTSNALQATAGGGEDGFLVKLNPAGTAIVYSTYLGGSGDDELNSAIVDSGGNVVLSGLTSSTDFPTVNPLQASNAGDFDGFVAKLNPAGTALQFSTYLGGSDFDLLFLAQTAADGTIYSTGFTFSTDFPTVNPLQADNAGGEESLLFRLNATGSALLFSTYLGGTGDDETFGFAVSPNGNSSIVGFTSSTDFPVANPLQTVKGGGADAFISQVNPTGTTLSFSSYLGGDATDRAIAAAVDASGSLYVGGRSRSHNFPTMNPLQAAPANPDAPSDPSLPGNSGFPSLDAIVFKISPADLPTIAFQSATYSVNEDAGSTTITLTRTGNSGPPVTVDYSASAGTASTPADFTAVSGTVSWGPSDTAPKTFIVPIVKDTTKEVDETINLRLSTPTNGAVLGPQNIAVLTVVNVNKGGAFNFGLLILLGALGVLKRQRPRRR